MNPADRFLPHPTENWYDRAIGTTGGDVEYVFEATPEQRRSYARFILAGNGQDNYELRAMAEWEPESLAPWADHVTRFDDAALDQLTSQGWPDYWWAALGASDAAVDDLAARIAAAPPSGPYMPTTRSAAFARVYLLLGADTDRALAHLGELGREHELIRWICANHGLAVPSTGSVVRRFTRTPQVIADRHESPSPGLRTDVPTADVLADPRGLGCAMPLSVVLDVDLSLLDGPLQGTYPFIMSFCSDCDADEEILGYRGWKRDGELVFDEERDERCPGYDEGVPDPLTDLGLRASSRYGPSTRSREVGRLGGRPSWHQYPAWPRCCDQPMFFVGQIDIGRFGGVGGNSHGFGCECGAGMQVTQIS